MPHDTPLITAISVGLVLAFIFGSLAQRFRLSPLVGYLLAGVVAGIVNGIAGFGFDLDPHLIEQLAELGIILLMFGVGLHFSPKDLMEVKKIALPGAIVQIGIATVLGAALAYWALDYSIGGAIIFGLALSVASTVVLLRALEERSAVMTERGKIAVGWLIVEDVAMVMALVILPALAGVLGGNSGGQEIATSTQPLWLTISITIGKVIAFVFVMLTIGKRAIPWTLEKVAGLGSKELFTLSTLAIALGVALGAAYLFEVSLALGAFFAGMMLNESELSHEAAADSLPLRDAFAVLFFVSVGMQLNLAVFLEHPFLIMVTFLIIVIGKSLGAYGLVRMFGYSKKTALTIAISLAQIGEFSFILIGLGVSFGLVDETGRNLLLASAILSILANPFLFIWLDRWIEANKEKPAVEEEKDEPVTLAPIPTHDHAIVIGYGSVGIELTKMLQAKNVPFVIIENDPYQADIAQKAGLPVIVGNGAAEDILQKAHPDTAILALIASTQPYESGAIVERISKANPAAIIVARAETDAAVDYLLSHGAHGAVMEKKELAFSMAEMAMAGERFAQRGLWPLRPATPQNETNAINQETEQQTPPTTITEETSVEAVVEAQSDTHQEKFIDEKSEPEEIATTDNIDTDKESA
ncbi:YbaL family putative K(+) efflux transporter [Neisseria sp. Ec49-e6-T10]|uniref:YbaL family putative K(+) efflux transporter n=1 Tax=Neisseria sp. Ec49-e6-T10 TaxID=3140744 RepID=UPI003EB8193D